MARARPHARAKHGRWLPLKSGHEPATDAELVTLAFPGMEGQPGSALRRKQLERAKTAIRKLEAAGELIIEDTRHGPLLLPPARRAT